MTVARVTLEFRLGVLLLLLLATGAAAQPSSTSPVRALHGDRKGDRGGCPSTNVCTKCSPACQVCVSSTTCAVCAPGYALNAGGKCTRCQAGCVVCAGGGVSTTTCLLCQQGLYPDPSTPGSCIKPAVANCSQVSALSANECAVCAPGYALNAGGKCTRCQAGCVVCAGGDVSTTTCLLCQQGLYPDPSTPGACIKPGVANCSQVSALSANECAVCAEGFSLNGTTCSSQPPPPPAEGLRPIITAVIADTNAACNDPLPPRCFLTVAGKGPATLAGTTLVTLYCSTSLEAIQACPPSLLNTTSYGTKSVNQASESVVFFPAALTTLKPSIYCSYVTDTNQCSVVVGPVQTS